MQQTQNHHNWLTNLHKGKVIQRPFHFSVIMYEFSELNSCVSKHVNYSKHVIITKKSKSYLLFSICTVLYCILIIYNEQQSSLRLL